MFAGWTCSVDSSTSTTAPPRDRIRVSDPHGELGIRGSASPRLTGSAHFSPSSRPPASVAARHSRSTGRTGTVPQGPCRSRGRCSTGRGSASNGSRPRPRRASAPCPSGRSASRAARAEPSAGRGTAPGGMTMARRGAHLHRRAPLWRCPIRRDGCPRAPPAL